jgi:hypothetical protein
MVFIDTYANKNLLGFIHSFIHSFIRFFRFRIFPLFNKYFGCFHKPRRTDGAALPIFVFCAFAPAVEFLFLF